MQPDCIIQDALGLSLSKSFVTKWEVTSSEKEVTDIDSQRLVKINKSNTKRMARIWKI